MDLMHCRVYNRVDGRYCTRVDEHQGSVENRSFLPSNEISSSPRVTSPFAFQMSFLLPSLLQSIAVQSLLCFDIPSELAVIKKMS